MNSAPLKNEKNNCKLTFVNDWRGGAGRRGTKWHKWAHHGALALLPLLLLLSVKVSSPLNSRFRFPAPPALIAEVAVAAPGDGGASLRSWSALLIAAIELADALLAMAAATASRVHVIMTARSSGSASRTRNSRILSSSPTSGPVSHVHSLYARPRHLTRYRGVGGAMLPGGGAAIASNSSYSSASRLYSGSMSVLLLLLLDFLEGAAAPPVRCRNDGDADSASDGCCCVAASSK